jgi:hypothetical protein
MLISILLFSCTQEKIIEDSGTVFIDMDGDGFSIEEDCDDTQALIYPQAEEYCDLIDNNCDGRIDEPEAVDAYLWYLDEDGDGYGVETQTKHSCTAPYKHSAYAGDCADEDPSYHPAAVERDCTDPNDYNCDGFVEYLDEDNDGYAACIDCEDDNPRVFPGAEAEAKSTCLIPTQTDEYYAAQSSSYFDTMDYRVDLEDWPPYSELVARWEWPPWLLLTAFSLSNIELTDTMLQLYPSIVTDRDCRAFDTQPFGRCYVTFYYDSHEGLGCPIYEEFTFNDQGEITFIEAWSDVDGLRPMTIDDPWAEDPGVYRLSTQIPGLGNAQGLIDLDGEAMDMAALENADIEDFVYRAENWYSTWFDEYMSSDDMWATGCGW